MQVLSNLTEYITLVDLNGIIRFVNKADFGLKPEDLIGQPYFKIVAPERTEDIKKAFELAITGTEGKSITPVTFPDGSAHWFESKTTPLYHNGEIIGMTFLSKNITKEKDLIQEVHENEERFKKLVEAASDIIYSCDIHGNFTYMNPVALSVSGLTPNNFFGVNFLTLTREDYQDKVGDFYQQQFKNRTKNTYYEFPMKSRSGEVFWLGQNVQIKTEGSLVIGFQALARDITERKEFEEMLIEARKKAEDSSKAKEQFLSVMSHEIRTPLNAVIGLTNLLLEEEPTKQQLEHLRAIKFSADSLLSIINDILDFSKIESGKIVLEKEDFNLEILVEGIHNALGMEAEAKSIDLNLNLDSKLPKYVNGDSVRLNQILLNLISNSIKFTEKGFVNISVSIAETLPDSWKIRFTITDTGIGIPKDMQNSIFESFTQASQETTRKYGGTGLGLTITKQLIDLHNGHIELSSIPGKGTEFTFEVTLDKAVETDITNDQHTQVRKFQKFNNTRCLLVEDNKMNQLVAGKYLEKWGIQFDIAENGRIAIEKLKSAAYDFILMDLEMPDMDGYETTRHIRTQLPEPINQLPIVAVTASAFSNVRTKVIKSGMNEYISKPFVPSKLYNIIARLTNQNQRESSDSAEINSKQKYDLIDLSYLKEASGGDRVFIQKMIETFIKHSPEYISNFQSAYSKCDFPELKRMAHKYKATVSIVGIKVIQKLIERLESNISKNENLDQIESLLAEISKHTEQASQELLQEIEQL